MSTSRNASCPCGSGKKYKRCCGGLKKGQLAGKAPDKHNTSDAETYPDRTFELNTGVKISSPYSLKLITAYVLLEQKDWFEDEIDFIRYFIKPGMNSIDIGANYGIYTFSIAQQTANQGKIWAFEPTSEVMRHLKYSKQLNLANNVELVQCALSDHCGEANLSISASAELNQLEHNNTASSSEKIEIVKLQTLDDFFSSVSAKSIDFMKLDAEGEEINIIKGGQEFFQRYSPLVMYEFVHAGKVNEGLISAFKNIGYDNYRLLPGLNILVPIKPEDLKRSFLLNLFACNKEQAAKLESKGLLISDSEATCDMPDNMQEYLTHYYNNIHAASALANTWEELAAPDYDKTTNTMSLFMVAHDIKLPAIQRYKAMEMAYNNAKSHSVNHKTLASLSTFARIANEFGHRKEAADALLSGAMIFNEARSVEVQEPVLPSTPWYDNVNPGENAAEWLLCSLLEGFVTLRHWSSFFTNDSDMQYLMAIKELGFASDEMERRILLIEQRYLESQK